MEIRGVVTAFLLSSGAVLVATDVWGTQASVPFTVGELTGAIVTLLTLGSSISLFFRPPRKRIGIVERGATPRQQPNPIHERVHSRTPCRPVEASLRPRAQARRKGQVSPYFPGILAWSYLSCPPLHHRDRPYAARPVATSADVIILDYEDCALVSKRLGLLPEHVSARPRPVS